MNQTKQTLSAIGEFGLIDWIRNHFPPLGREVVKGIGDDAAILRVPPDRDLLFAIDTIVEGVDFDLKRPRTTPRAIGRKAIAVNLSDIAAMGGRPFACLVSLILPKNLPLTFVEELYRGLSKMARQWGAGIVGGDISRGKELSVTVSILGTSRRGKSVLRSGAKLGDLICVTGTLGGSILGKHLFFTPRLDEGEWLGRAGVSAMIDISDGLIQDLSHLAGKRFGYVLDETKVPVSQAALKLAGGNRKKALAHALSDGEDFELLFTVSPARFKRLFANWKRRFETPLAVIGRIVRVEEGKKPLYQTAGFRHF